MREQFSKYISEHSLIASGERVLVAVSGGVDSMTLLHLLTCYFGDASRLAVAHCNFSLRGSHSDADQALVERCCVQLGVRCHSIRFDTKGECVASGESTQMAARRLRYAFFDDLCDEFGYSRVAIAHHSDDAIETFFINMLRGTGLRGLTGISVSRNRIIRPLLFASRLDIERYSIDFSVDYLTDASNSNDDYVRNRLRHDIVPRFHSMSRGFGRVMGGNVERLGSAQRFIDHTISSIASRVIGGDRLDLGKLSGYGELDFLLFELLRPYGFSGDVVSDIILATHSGKRFYSEGYIATLDRGFLILRSRDVGEFEERVIFEDDLCVEFIDSSRLLSLVTPSNVALLAADALVFPLRLRRWCSGDWFIPLGMGSQKLVSDFLIDSKVSMPDKDFQGVLLSGDTIVWLVGRRIDDRYKIRESTVRAVRITL